MAAFKLNLKVDQGATFSQVVTWKAGTPAAPVNLAGCTARMQARGKLADTAVLFDLTVANGGIALGDSAGTVTIKLTSAQTAAITWTSAVYDLEITFADSTVRRLLTGGIAVSPEVTRG